MLVVDDEPDMADLYVAWLEREYDVIPAYDGNEALDLVDDSFDVVLLDRSMPGLSGDVVLGEIRRQHLGCRVAMVTAVEPDFDAIELGFDDYFLKPIAREELIETVEVLRSINDYDEAVQEYFALVSKMACLQSTYEPYELEAREAYLDLQSRVESIGRDARETFEDVRPEDDLEATFGRLTRHGDVHSLTTAPSD